MPVIHQTDEAIGFIPLPNDSGKPITVIGTDAIRAGFDEMCLQQAVNSRMAPGVTDVVLNPDGHAGYGAPIGCVMVSPTHSCAAVWDCTEETMFGSQFTTLNWKSRMTVDSSTPLRYSLTQMPMT